MLLNLYLHEKTFCEILCKNSDEASRYGRKKTIVTIGLSVPDAYTGKNILICETESSRANGKLGPIIIAKIVINVET